MGKKHRNADLLNKVCGEQVTGHSFPNMDSGEVLIALSRQQATEGSFYSDLKIAGICGVKKN